MFCMYRFRAWTYGILVFASFVAQGVSPSGGSWRIDCMCDQVITISVVSLRIYPPVDDYSTSSWSRPTRLRNPPIRRVLGICGTSFSLAWRGIKLKKMNHAFDVPYVGTSTCQIVIWT
jgi:hypothetical protein